MVQVIDLRNTRQALESVGPQVARRNVWVDRKTFVASHGHGPHGHGGWYFAAGTPGGPQMQATGMYADVVKGARAAAGAAGYYSVVVLP